MSIPPPAEPTPIEPEPEPLDPDVPGRPPDPVDLSLAELERGLDRLFPPADPPEPEAELPDRRWWQVEGRRPA